MDLEMILEDIVLALILIKKNVLALMMGQDVDVNDVLLLVRMSF